MKTGDLRGAQQRLRSAKVCRGDTPPGELCPLGASYRPTHLPTSIPW